MNQPAAAPKAFPIALVALGVSLLIIPLNVVIWWLAVSAKRDATMTWFAIFGLLAFVQFVSGLTAVVAGARQRMREGQGGVVAIVFGALSTLGAVAGGVLGVLAPLAAAGAGGAWGRPLRVRGRQLHPNLSEGSDWTKGEQPDGSGLAEVDRRALEALWLHDAQKEHASVPAFARISWLLAAVGAPAELMEWAHRAGLEEIDHTRRCFALAAGYAGRSHTIEPMPDLLIGALELKADPLVVLAQESLADGCQLEDFNADVAAECAKECEEPATRDVLERIAREERTHADFSWALLEWLLTRDEARVRPVIEQAVKTLEGYARPTAVSWDKKALVERADAEVLRRHGRLPDERWGALWVLRLEATTRRVAGLLDRARLAA